MSVKMTANASQVGSGFRNNEGLMGIPENGA
jgi:hypothetical protein